MDMAYLHSIGVSLGHLQSDGECLDCLVQEKGHEQGNDAGGCVLSANRDYR